MPSSTAAKWAWGARLTPALARLAAALAMAAALATVAVLAAGCGKPAVTPGASGAAAGAPGPAAGASAAGGAAAAARPPQPQPGSALDSQLVIYIREAQASGLPLVWNIRKIALEQAGGNQLVIPGTEVTLRTSDIDQGQKLVAVLEVPKGEYTGLTLFTRDVAFEDTRQPVSAEANFVTVAYPFSAVSGNAKTILMVAEFAAPGADRSAFRFQPQLRIEDEPAELKGKLIYVSNEMSSNISVIDKALRRVVRTIYVGTRPSAIAADRRRNRLYIADRRAGALYEMDMISQHLLKALEMDYVDEPVHIEPVPSKDLLMVVAYGSDAVHLVDPFTLQIIETVAVGDGPVDALFSEFWNLAFVVNQLDNSVSVLNLDDRPVKVDTTLFVDLRPSGATLDGSMGWLYVTNSGSYNLSAIKLETLAIERVFPVGIGATDVILDPYGRQLYVAMAETAEIICVDPYTGVTTRNIRMPGRPGRLAFDSEDKKLYVTIPEADAVMVVDTITGEIQYRIETGNQPSSMATRF